MTDMLDRKDPTTLRPGMRLSADYASSVQTITDQLIADAARRLGEAAPGSQIVLFGSNARGEAGPRSDVDFLVIEPEVSSGAEESVRLRRALWGMRIPTDIIVVSRDFAERHRHVRGSIVHAALSEGRTLVPS